MYSIKSIKASKKETSSISGSIPKEPVAKAALSPRLVDSAAFQSGLCATWIRLLADLIRASCVELMKRLI